MEQTVTFRPRRARVVAVGAAVAIVAVFTIISFGLTGTLGQGGGVFRRGDQIAMIGLGVAFACGALLFLRPKVVADRERVLVRNVLGTIELPWSDVRYVRFERGVSFASLELDDEEQHTIVALQQVDGEYAHNAVSTLRDLHHAATAPAAATGAATPADASAAPAAATGAATPADASATPAPAAASAAATPAAPTDAPGRRQGAQETA